MQFLKRVAAGAFALGLSLPGLAAAEDVTLNVLYNNPGFTKYHQPLAEEFQKRNPGIKLAFQAPAVDYNAGHQQVLRAAVSGNPPDVYFAGYNLLGELAQTLAKRHQITDLGPFIAAEGGKEFMNKNFAPPLAALGVVDGVQYGLPVNASSPIMYVNADLVRKAGGDPDKMPDTWAGLVELAAKIKALDPKLAGMAYDVGTWSDDWLWQAMIYQQGGELVDPKTGKVAFDNEIGLNALKLARSFVTKGGQAQIEWQQSQQQFGAGLTGFMFSTPAQVQNVENLVANKFQLKTTTFPLDNKAKGGVPTGGNAVVILTQDKAKQAAAWKYAKWVTGPEAQNIIVRITGYLPTNIRATGAEYLAPYYAEHPNVATAARQADRSRPWGGYPGGDSVRIWRTQRDLIASVMRGDLSPEDGLKKIVAETNALMK